MSYLLSPPSFSPPRPELARPDDFRSLGLVREENRPEVIRRALKLVAAPLVVRTQKKHHAFLEDQLAAVLSAGYRALDPRMRNRFTERIALSLQDPNLLPAVSPAPWAPAVAERTIETPQGLGSGPSRRRYPPQKLVGKFFVVGGFAVAFAAIVICLWVSSRAQTRLASASSSSAGNEAKETNNPTEIRDPTEAKKVQRLQEDFPTPLPQVHERPTSVLQEVGSDPADPPQANNQTPQLLPPSSPLPAADLQANKDSDDDSKTENPPTSSPTVDPPSATSASSTITPQPATTEIPVPPSVPRESELKEARSKLASIEQGQPKGHAERVSRLRRMYDAAAEHSADRYVLLEALLDDYILNHKLPEAWQTRQLILDSFPVTDFAVASAAAKRVMQAAASLTQCERAVDGSLRAAHQGISEEAFDEVNELLREASSIAAKASSKELALRVRAVKEGGINAKRIRIELPKDATPNDIEAAKVNQRGRYLCLHLDRWEEGLPWLARCNEPRLARAAQGDLEGDLEKATKEYLDLAKTQKGRAGEALKLRALTLMRKEAQSAEGLDAEQLRRRIAMLEADIPVDRLIPVGHSLGEQVPGAPPMPKPVGVDDFSGLVGRFRIAGKDVGALIRYPGEVGLGPSELSQILSQVAVKQVIDPDVEFQGFVRVPMATTVVFECRGPKPPEGKTVLEIDGRAVTLEPMADYFIAKLDLSAGAHRVRFRTASKQLSLIALGIRDDRSGNKLPLFHDAQMFTSLRNGFTTRLTVTIRGPN